MERFLLTCGAGAGASCTHMASEKLSLKQMKIEMDALPGTGLLPTLVAASCWLPPICLMSETADYAEKSHAEVSLLPSVHLCSNVSTRR